MRPSNPLNSPTIKMPWTDERLRRLFERYRSRYWPRRLRRYRIVGCPLDGILGECDWATNTLRIDVAAHRTDREVRSTMLHEMCHAAAGPKTGHGSAFFAQMERLLALGAPLTISFPENPGRAVIDSIPKQFPLCRARLQPQYTKESRELERRFGHMPAVTITPEMIAQNFEDAAYIDGLGWRDAFYAVGDYHNFLDIDGRPTAWARRYLPTWRQAHRRGLQNRRLDDKAKERMEACDKG